MASSAIPPADLARNTETGDLTSGWHVPFWLRASVPSQSSFPKLASNVQCDVCVVGGGIAGVSTAYHLSRAGKRVVLLEDGALASGETGRSTAHLVTKLDDHFSVLKKLHGEDAARIAYESTAAAIDAVEAAVNEHGIDCGFARLDGYLIPGDNVSKRFMDDEAAAGAAVGIQDISLVERAPIAAFNTGVAIRYGRQGLFDPLRYTVGLAHAAVKSGAAIYTQTRASKIQGGKDGNASVETSDGFVVTANYVVEATNVPVTNRILVHAKQECVRTYVITATIPKEDFTFALFWDTEAPYHYVRPAAIEGDSAHWMLLIGGEDHDVGMEMDGIPERYSRLEQWARMRWPSLGPVQCRWSGQVVEPVDGLGYVGRNTHDYPNILICTGDSGNGITNGSMAGMLLTDIVLGRPNPWETLYSPSRHPGMRTVPKMLKHDLNINMQYRDHVTSGDSVDIEDLPRCGGAVVRRGTGKYAVYRDAEGKLHACSAVCKHLGGIVRWNDDEKTFDCPVHGSRYSATGRAINGPTIADLDAVDVSQVIGQSRQI